MKTNECKNDKQPKDSPKEPQSSNGNFANQDKRAAAGSSARERERGRERERWCTNQKLRALKQMFTPTKQAEQQQQQQLKRGQQAAACPVFGELELWQN